MTDQIVRRLIFGANVDPASHPVGLSTRQAQLVDRLGLDLVTVQDHRYQAAFDDTWTLLAHLAARTERVLVVPTVTVLPLRPPAVLAKGAATLDRLSGGRFRLGLGTGGLWEPIAAMGGSRRTPREAVDALQDALDVIAAMWSGKRAVRTYGEHYAISGIHPGPAPSADLQVWLGAYGPRMLALTGARTGGWLPSSAHLPPERLADAVARVEDAAHAVGRGGQVEKIYNISGSIAPVSDGPFVGPVQQWVDTLATLARDVGMSGFVLWPTGGPDAYQEQVTCFAQEVAPAVRAAL